MFTFMHAADLHLDSPLRGLGRHEGAPVEDIRQASRRALGEMVEYILENSIPLLLIAGDLYDDDCPDFQTLLHFALQMNRLKDNGTRVALIRGNHDAGNRMTRSMKLPDNVRSFGSARPATWRIDDLGAAVHAQSFGSAEVLDNLALSYPDPVPGLFNIGLLHTSISGRPGHRGYAPCELNHLLAKGYDYWALGHVHKYEIVHKDPYIVFPGCIQGRHILEPGPRGCVRVDVDSTGKASIERVFLDVFRWHTLEVDIAGVDTLYQVADRAGQDLQKVFSRKSQGRPMGIRIVLKGAGAAHHDLLRREEELRALLCRAATEISRQKIWMEKIIINTSPDINFEELKSLDTPQGDLARFIDELKDDPGCFAELGFSLDELKARLVGTGVSIPDFSDPDRRSDALDQARKIILPYLSGR